MTRNGQRPHRYGIEAACNASFDIPPGRGLANR